MRAATNPHLLERRRRLRELEAKAQAEFELGQTALDAGNKEKAAAHGLIALAILEVAANYKDPCSKCGRSGPK